MRHAALGMLSTFTFSMTVSMGFMGPALSAAENETDSAVTVRIVERTFNVVTADPGPRRAKEAAEGEPRGWYPIKSTKRQETASIETIELDNGLITAVIAPEWGARLLRVTDSQTGVDYFEVRDEIENHLAWQAGGVKASFPFFEHGMQLQQPAGWRIVTGDDGSTSVAMDMRFTHHQAPADATRYGRYSEEIMSVIVTVRPGSTAVEWHQRKDNPNPLARGDRFWNLVCFPQNRYMTEEPYVDNKGRNRVRKHYDEERMLAEIAMLFPANWVTDHGPTTVHTSPHWSNSLNWRVSHFALEMAAPHVGAYYPLENVSRLRVDHHTERRAAKLYSDRWCTMVEHWGGVGDVFEHPGVLRPGHDPVHFTQSFWVTQDMGPVTWSDTNVAIAINEGVLELSAPRTYAEAVITTADGEELVRGPVGPHQVLSISVGERFHRGSEPAPLQISLDGDLVLTQAFPLTRPVPAKETDVPDAIQAEFAAIAADAPNPYRIESESFGRNEGMPGAADASNRAAAITADSDPVKALSLARACYRIGDFEHVERIATMFPGPEADLILGVLAFERGEDTDFGTAGWEADWLRSLQARAAGDTDAALAAVTRYLEAVPQAWYPRLAQAIWTNDLGAAQALAAELPSSPEAQLAIELCGGDPDFQNLIDGNPSAAEHLARFRAMVEDGAWVALPRFKPGS